MLFSLDFGRADMGAGQMVKLAARCTFAALVPVQLILACPLGMFDDGLMVTWLAAGDLYDGEFPLLPSVKESLPARLFRPVPIVERFELVRVMVPKDCRIVLTLRNASTERREARCSMDCDIEGKIAAQASGGSASTPRFWKA